jgi:hypothetical protein
MVIRQLGKNYIETNINLPEILLHIIVSTLDLDNRVIEDLSVVISVCLHTGDKTHKGDVYANLRCCATSSYGDCGAKLVGPIIPDVSTKRAADTDEGDVSLNATKVLMLHRILKMIQQRSVEANKTSQETEEERDELYNQIEQIEKQLHPKRARTDDDAYDAHEMLT